MNKLTNKKLEKRIKTLEENMERIIGIIEKMLRLEQQQTKDKITRNNKFAELLKDLDK